MSACSRAIGQRLIHMGRVKPAINPDLKEKISNQDVNVKRLPTRRNYGFVQMPVQLEMAARKKISQFEDKKFRNEAMLLRNVMYNRRAPDDHETLAKKKLDIRLELELRGKTNVPYSYDPTDQTLPEDMVIQNHELQAKIEGKLEEKRRDWHYFEYDDYASTLYMTMRLAPNYAGIKTVMEEIKAQLPEYRPQSVLDFGSGMGTTSWAVHSTWPNCAKEILNVDISKNQQELNEYLQRGGRDRGESLPGVFHRQYLPTSNRSKYDMIVAAYSLLDLPNEQNRVNVIENLWNKTTDLLVLIERGNIGGFKTISEARHLVLELCGHKITKRFDISAELKPQLRLTEPGCHIVAPCSHEYICPRFSMSAKNNYDLCSFPIYFEPLDFGTSKGPIMHEKFSYVVLRKGGATSATNNLFRSDDGLRWPRIVQKRRKSSGLVTQRMCCPNGHLCEISVTAKNYGKETFKLAKSCDWGDILPIKIDDTY